MAKPLNLTGIRFGKLVAISMGKKRNRLITWDCVCDCGKNTNVITDFLRSGATKSCGCLRAETMRKLTTKHGLSKDSIYILWRAILNRVNGKSNKPHYKNVTICKEWENDFHKFKDWCILNGWVKGMNIDKDIIPISLGITERIYSPEMCSIVSPKQNSRSKTNTVMITHNNQTKPFSEWCEIYNLNYSVTWNRMKKYGHPLEYWITHKKYDRIKK